jgi:hypothetical protein
MSSGDAARSRRNANRWKMIDNEGQESPGRSCQPRRCQFDSVAAPSCVKVTKIKIMTSPSGLIDEHHQEEKASQATARSKNRANGETHNG